MNELDPPEGQALLKSMHAFNVVEQNTGFVWVIGCVVV